jgi:hypothetical protein
MGVGSLWFPRTVCSSKKKKMVLMQFLLNLAVVSFLTTNFGTLIAIGASLCVKEMMLVCGDQIDHCECFFPINLFVLNIS